MDKLINLIKNREKHEWLIVGAIAFCLIIGMFYIFNTKGDNKFIGEAKSKETTSFVSSTEHGDLKSYFTNQINKQIKEQNFVVKNVEEKLDSALNTREKEVDELKKQNQMLEDKLNELKNKMERGAITSNAVLSGQNKDFEGERAAFDPEVIPSQYSGQYNLPPMPSVKNNHQVISMPSDEIELVSASLTNNTAKFKNINSYVPAGTYSKAVVIGGVDANTEVSGGNAQTRVVTMRILDNGRIAGGHTSILKDCTLLASAYGVASSERVALRGERLTCVAPSGDVLETDITASIYGNDGRQDVRGRMVYPESKLLTRAFVAGSLSGIGSGVANSFSTQSISPLGATATVPSADIFKYGAAQGVGKGLDKLADYYIKRAEQLQPVVQLGSGSLVTVVIQRGFYLDGKTHSEASTQNPESPFDKKNSGNNERREAKSALANLKETVE